MLDWITTRPEISVPAAASLITALCSVGLSAWLNHQQHRLLKTSQDLKSAAEDHGRELEEKLDRSLRVTNQLQELLAKQTLIQFYNQPVILIGPPGTGKTSLLWHWHSPWSDTDSMARASKLKDGKPESRKVPVIHSTTLQDLVPFPGYANIRVKCQLNLGLQVWDFPGEIRFLKEICERIVQETRLVTQSTKKSLGVVVICFFNAAKANPALDWDPHYYKECAKELSKAVRDASADISKLVLVYNRVDELLPDGSERSMDEIIEMCTKRFSPAIKALSDLVVTQHKVFAVPAMLEVERNRHGNLGINSIKAHASRDLARAFSSARTESGEQIKLNLDETYTGVVAIDE